MTPTYAVKKGVRYRYYISKPLVQGQPEISGSISRVPASEVEQLVIKAVREHIEAPAALDDREVLQTNISRIEIHPGRLTIKLKADPAQPAGSVRNTKSKAANSIIQIAWMKPPPKRKRDIILPKGIACKDTKPIRAENRAKLLSLIALGRRWLAELVAGKIKDVEQIAIRERCSVRKVNMTISLAFLAPDLVRATAEGQLPQNLNASRLYDAPAEWTEQFRVLGLSQPTTELLQPS